MSQLTIDDYLLLLSEPEKVEFQKGDRVYKLILDVIETGVIESMWKMRNGRYGYSAKKDYSYFTFWTQDIGDTVFKDKKVAYEEAKKFENVYKVIRAKDMKIVKEKNFVNSDGEKNRLETVKILEGNMIYFNMWPCYPFLEILDNEKQVTERFKEIVKNINNITKIEIKESLEMEDMYLAVNGVWSSYDYAHFNNAVRVGT